MNENTKPLFLIVDDDDKFRYSILDNSLLSDYANLYGMSSCEEALEFLKNNSGIVNLILLDYDFRNYGSGNQMNGLELLEIITKNWKHIPVIMMSGITDIRGKVAIEAINNLAYGFLDKPFDIEKIIDLYENYDFNKTTLDNKISQLNEKLKNYGMITNNSKFLEKIYLAYESLRKKNDRIVTIVGETGSGKSHLAVVLHKITCTKKSEPAIVHCSNLGTDINTIRDYLFGHSKDSWTGASSEKPSIFKNAETVIFDDIQHISYEAQKILLEVFQEKHYSVFGKESKKEKVTSKIIVTTTIHPNELIKFGFLEEFVNRISAEIISIPPLIKRTEDISSLIMQFARKYKNREITFDNGLLRYILDNYKYKNIRELHHFIDDLIVHSDTDYISFEVLRKLLLVKNEDEAKKIEKSNLDFDNFDLEEKICNFRKMQIENALKKFNGNIKKTSEALGYKNHNGLLHWIKKLNIDVNSFKK